MWLDHLDPGRLWSVSLHVLSGRAMRPRSADSFRKDFLPQSRKGRQGTQRSKSYSLLVISYWEKKEEATSSSTFCFLLSAFVPLT
jgi:hypothetical protein